MAEGGATTMIHADIDALLEAPLNATLATNRRDGAPQLSPIWYLYEEGRFHISIGADSVKARNVRRDPRVSLCIDEGGSSALPVRMGWTAPDPRINVPMGGFL